MYLVPTLRTRWLQEAQADCTVHRSLLAAGNLDHVQTQKQHAPFQSPTVESRAKDLGELTSSQELLRDRVRFTRASSATTLKERTDSRES
jgi:hypothetical protein